MRYALRLVGIASLLLIGLLILALCTEFSPAALEEVIARCDDADDGLDADSPFTVVSWNLQYAAGRTQHFFYDGGDAVSVPEAEVSETLAGITAALHTLSPDITLLQEVDRASDRTGRVDQLPPYRAAADAPCQLSTPYHRSPFVPHPPGQALGRVDMHLALLTPAGLKDGRRHALPLLDESRLRQMFNLKRALLTAELPISGVEQKLALAVSHLSAFSAGDGTLQAQIDVLRRWMDERPPGQPWILGADLNTIPPGDDPSRLDSHSESYRGAQPALEALLATHKNAFPRPLEPSSRTYLPFGASEPDRTIDYLFYGGPLELRGARVAREYSTLSDHLPLVSQFAVIRTESP